METIDQIHQKLETMDLTPFEKRDLKPLVEQAFRAGFTRALEQAGPLAGYSNLTAAISAGEPIDWERLDGLKVRCVKSGVGTLYGTLKRDPDCLPNVCGAWWDASVDDAYISALVDAWYGSKGWTLYVEGEIPLHRKTADQLDEGRCFLGKQGADFDPELMIVVGFTEDPKLNKIKPLGEHPGYLEPWQVEVLEEYGIGTFQKPEGK